MKKEKCFLCGDTGECQCRPDHTLLPNNEYRVPLCLKCYEGIDDNVLGRLKITLNEYYSFIEKAGDIDDPQFEEATRVLDWRNHVPFIFKEMWDKLTNESRLIIAIMAAKSADVEEWD